MDIQWRDIASRIESLFSASFSIGGSQVTLADLLVVLGILVGTWLLSRGIRRALEGFMRQRDIGDQGTVSITLRILHYSIMVIGLMTALSQVNINLSGLFAAGAVFAVGIGFALKNLSENFVSGIILMFERSIKPGDIVEVDGYVVRVVRLGIRTTLARNRNDEEILVPNSHLVDATVKNFTLHDTLLRIRAQVGVEYSSDMSRVVEALQKAAEAQPWRLRSHDPVVLMKEFGSSSVDFEVSVWTDDPWRAPRLRSQLMQGIWLALADADIAIAFPQLDVHFDVPVTEAPSGLPQAS
jgi:small-conductance mechanosensitive channel